MRTYGAGTAKHILKKDETKVTTSESRTSNSLLELRRRSSIITNVKCYGYDESPVVLEHQAYAKFWVWIGAEICV